MSWGKIVTGVLVAVAAVALVVRYRAELGHQVIEIEQWIASLGIWGPLVFAGLFILLTSLFFPDSLLSAVAGALFGTFVGAGVVIGGALVTQSISFGVSRHFLQDRVRQAISRRSKLSAIARAVEREGFRLQLLLRLSPLNPVIVSYVLGTTGTRFRAFMLACLALAPGLFVQVYGGYAASHLVKVAGQVSDHSTFHTVLVVMGLIACLVLFIMITRSARKAIAEADA